jgi:hypothetical protein
MLIPVLAEYKQGILIKDLDIAPLSKSMVFKGTPLTYVNIDMHHKPSNVRRVNDLFRLKFRRKNR